ncbi:MAG: hypothetical protein ACJA0Q_002051 [Saprospiraceae bacterium]|jgi:hypothetical protein
MTRDILEEIVKKTLKSYLLQSDQEIDLLIQSPSSAIKERVGTLDDLQIIIYSNDHNPPHFHVKSKNLKINAKFKIEDCSIISGEVSRKNLKKIFAFYHSTKGKLIMEKIWNKRS